MEKTPARIQFKRHFGQANHYLVTTLIALHHLDDSSVVAAPPELHAAWNPKNKTASIERSRVFVARSFLGWAVDSVDMYVSLLNRKPNFLQNALLISKLDGKGRSVLGKVEIFGEHYKLHPATLALIDVLITWRNNVFHELAENSIDSTSLHSLTTHSAFIKANYRGLVADGLSEKAQHGGALTFKETASLINAAHNFVQEVDTAVLSAFDRVAFCKEVVQDALNDRKQETGFAAKYYGLPIVTRRRFLQNWIKNRFGITEPGDDAVDACLHLSRERDE
jgi:hypothetical protein